MTATCGLPECSSSCHAGAGVGRYCAPARCYCGGCPSHVPVERSAGPVTVDQLAERRQLAVDDARRQLAAASFRHDVDERVADKLQTFGLAGLVAA
jgi:hypothetical protein